MPGYFILFGAIKIVFNLYLMSKFLLHSNIYLLYCSFSSDALLILSFWAGSFSVVSLFHAGILPYNLWLLKTIRILTLSSGRSQPMLLWYGVPFSSVQLLSLSDSMRPHGLQDARLSCPSLTPGVYSNPCPLSRWYHPNISFSVIPFSCLQSFPASGSFQMIQFFTSSGQSIGISASASVFLMNIQDWFPLGWTGWISLQSKGLSRVFSSTTVQKHQFFGAQLSSQSNSHIHTWPLEKP